MKTLVLLFGVSTCMFAQLTNVLCAPGGSSQCHASQGYSPSGYLWCGCTGCCPDGSTPDANYHVWWNVTGGNPPAGGQGSIVGGGFGGTVKVSGSLLLFCTNWSPPKEKSGAGYDAKSCLGLHETVPIVLDCNTP